MQEYGYYDYKVQEFVVKHKGLPDMTNAMREATSQQMAKQQQLAIAAVKAVKAGRS